MAFLFNNNNKKNNTNDDALKKPLLANNNNDLNRTLHLDSSSALRDASTVSSPPRLERSESSRLAMAKELSGSIQSLGSRRSTMLRQQSQELMESFKKAETLLEGGVDGYIEGVRRLLHVDGKSQAVSVALKGLSYKARTPLVQAGNPHEMRTVGSEVMRPFRNLVSGIASLGSRCVSSSASSRAAAPTNTSERVILNDLTAYFPPSRLTLVLGPPGSGKTSFLRAISGQLSTGPGVSNGGAVVEGELFYNGRNVRALRNLGAWSVYVPQSDEHQALLTTRETIEFAWRCRREPSFDPSRFPPERRAKVEALREIEVDIALAILGLTNCADTIIGDSTTKGVSGGEKRRVTLGESMVTGARVMCADEISTGLDSSTTYDIVAYLGQAARLLENNIVVALLQPPPEVIDLFDDVVVLAEGRIIYHGEREGLLGYFESLGFKCPDRKDVGDFVQEITTKKGSKLYADPSRTTAGHPPPSTAEEFERRWKASERYRAELQKVNETFSRAVEMAASPAAAARAVEYDHDSTPTVSFTRSLWLFAAVTMTLRLRQKAELASKVFANVVMGLFFGSLFFSLDVNEWYMKSMLLFQVPSFVMSTSFPVTQIVAQQKPIFLKHVDAKFFSPLVFTVAQFVVALPFIVFDIAVFGNIVYWMCGLASPLVTFLTFLALSLSFGIQANALNTMIPFVTNKQESSVMLGILFLCTFMINCGLVATPDIIPTPLLPLFWFNPMAWIYRALAINEYHSGGEYDTFPCTFEIQGHKITVQERCGDYFLEARQTANEDYYVWGAIAVMWGFTLLCVLVTVYAVGNVRFEKDRSRRQEEAEESTLQGEDAEMMVMASSSRSRPPPLMRQDSVLLQQKVLCVRNLSYSIKIDGEDVDFLKGVSFWALPGRMTALMGSSGAGKTTLMDVVAGRKTVGKMRGEILVDGKPKIQAEFRKYAGYVEQFGVHAPASTVRESLEFSAELRLPSGNTPLQKRNFVNETLDLLELTDLQDALCAGLSMEQNKRLTLGVELVANPSIVFADEPTSGLDARAAAIVMRVLSNVARSGRAVVCTIHQPSTVVFNFFDDLLLLRRGGEVVYFGELGVNSETMIAYFEALPETPKCPKNGNPSTWMLEVIGAGTDANAAGRAFDYAGAYKKSALCATNIQRLDGEIAATHVYDAKRQAASPSRLERHESELRRSYARNFFAQFGLLTRRGLDQMWRTPEYSLARFLVITVFGLMFSFIFFQQEMKNVADIQSRVILIFFFSTLAGLYSLYAVVPFSISRRALFYRERSTGMYSLVAHVVSETAVELPYLLVVVVVSISMLYWIVGLNPSPYRFLWMISIVFAQVYVMTMLGLLFAALMPDVLAAQLSAISFVQILQIFSGVLIPGNNLAKAYKPLYWFSFFRWEVEGLISTQFAGDDTPICEPFGKAAPAGTLAHRLGLCTRKGTGDLRAVVGIQSTVEKFALGEFLSDFKYENRWYDLAYLIGWFVVVRFVLTLLVLRFVSHNKR